MKKLLTFALMLALVISLVGCSLLPEDLAAKVEDIKNSILGTEPEVPDETPDETPDDQPQGHVHEFAPFRNKEATCDKDGKETLKCACGELKETVYPALGHDMQFFEKTQSNCDQYGSIVYKCATCGKKETQTTPPTEHEWADLVEASRLIICTKEGCSSAYLYKTEGKYDDVLVFSFGDEEKATLADVHTEIATLLNESERYDATKHAYAESGELYEAYEAAYAIYERYTDLIYSAQGQYQLAQTLYYSDVKNSELEAIFNDMSTYYTELVSKYYELSQPWYDSMFREFFFYGATEEEINAFLFESNTVANPEYTALKNRNDEIELEVITLRENSQNEITGDEICILYAEFVENSNKIAALLGYDNYVEYAYENVYDREYSYQDVAEFFDYVKKFITPIYNEYYDRWNSITKNISSDTITLNEYYTLVSNSFFEDRYSNQYFNDYIDEMEMAFNAEKSYSFSDELNDLMADGNLFRGTYSGAYVTYIVDGSIPIAYFGKGYDNAFTVAHEFGHYMNEIYNDSQYNQSFDLLETHSQGQEMLFLYYMYTQNCLTAKGIELVETYCLLNTLSSVMAALQVDCFEQAVYLNYYDGPNSDIIMADGKITSDEYDLLYSSISEELGIKEDYRQDEYWRYGMTVTSPCYYVSYSISAINALQLYAKAHTEGFDAAKDSYLDLFTYTDSNPDMTLIEVLEYADLDSYMDKNLYESLMGFYLNR